jgi:hypothetical protein
VKKAYLLYALLLLCLFICRTTDADTNPRVFTNDDLSKREVSVSSSATNGHSSAKKRPSRVGSSGNREQERWCSKGRIHRKKVEDSKADLALAETEYSKALSGRRLIKKGRGKSGPSDLKVKRARLKLDKAESALNNLEQDAHQKNVPPGWLRCQFSY